MQSVVFFLLFDNTLSWFANIWIFHFVEGITCPNKPLLKLLTSIQCDWVLWWNVPNNCCCYELRCLHLHTSWYIQVLLPDWHHVVPFWRPELWDEVWKLDLQWLQGNGDNSLTRNLLVKFMSTFHLCFIGWFSASVTAGRHRYFHCQWRMGITW